MSRGGVALQNDVNKGGWSGRALLLGDQNAGKRSLLYRWLFPDRFDLTELDQSAVLKAEKLHCTWIYDFKYSFDGISWVVVEHHESGQKSTIHGRMMSRSDNKT